MTYDGKKLITKARWDLLFTKYYPQVAKLPEEECISKILLMALDDEVSRIHKLTTERKSDQPVLDQPGQGLPVPVFTGSILQGRGNAHAEDNQHAQLVTDDDDETQAPLRGVGIGTDGNISVVYESSPFYKDDPNV